MNGQFNELLQARRRFLHRPARWAASPQPPSIRNGAPGPGSEFTENLVEFFQNMLSVMSPQKSQVVNQSFWQLTGDQLLRNLINCFLLAKQPLTLDGLCEFVTNAPTNRDAAKEDKWPKLPVFGDCLKHAKEAVKGADDLRVFKMLEQYWLKAYPTLAPETRSCITISFSAMLDALRARHIYDMLSPTTTITPESIFNGRIVVLDLPINEFKNAGLLVQSAWKYLYQRAILRRADKAPGQRLSALLSMGGRMPELPHRF